MVNNKDEAVFTINFTNLTYCNKRGEIVAAESIIILVFEVGKHSGKCDGAYPRAYATK